jgi:hypothetical protein
VFSPVASNTAHSPEAKRLSQDDEGKTPQHGLLRRARQKKDRDKEQRPYSTTQLKGFFLQFLFQ